jgi:hypothetical protein
MIQLNKSINKWIPLRYDKALMDKQFSLLPDIRSVLQRRTDCRYEIIDSHISAVENTSCVLLRCGVGQRATHIYKGRGLFVYLYNYALQP